MPERPERLKANGRAEDQVFEAAEKLFRRYRRADYADGQFLPTGFSFNTPQSLNRQKYSEPADVLFSETDQFASWGVLSFRVDDIPTLLPVDTPTHSFFPKHVPLRENYAHSELWSDRIPPTAQYHEPSKTVKKLCRAILSQRVMIEIVAAV